MHHALSCRPACPHVFGTHIPTEINLCAADMGVRVDATGKSEAVICIDHFRIASYLLGNPPIPDCDVHDLPFYS